MAATVPIDELVEQISETLAALTETLERVEAELRRIADAQSERQRMTRYGR